MKRLLFFLSLFVISCAHTSKTETIRGNGWKFEVPPGWIFTHMGYDREIVLVGNSIKNFGSKRMMIFLSQKCLSNDQSEKNPNLGFGFKWLGGRVGYLDAFVRNETDGSKSVCYTATVPVQECTWKFTCSGDYVRSDEVKEICGNVLSSLEFRR